MTLDFIKVSPTGNTTILVTSQVQSRLRAEISREIMKPDSVCGEQVGFLEAPNDPKCDIRLCMMGGEFCANATMAAGTYLARRDGANEAKYLIEVSGATKPLEVAVKKDADAYVSTVPMPLPAKQSLIEISGEVHPIVHMPGISHAILPLNLAESFSVSDIRRLSEKTDNEAFGLIFYSNGVMRPFVYVKPTDTAVWESACGSGTAAVGVYKAMTLGENSIAVSQPGGIIKAEAKAENGEIVSLSITGKSIITTEGQVHI